MRQKYTLELSYTAWGWLWRACAWGAASGVTKAFMNHILR